MRALTIWQPYASLFPAGAKKFETRSWRTDYRGPIAIHAALRPMGWIMEHTDEAALHIAARIFGAEAMRDSGRSTSALSADMIRTTSSRTRIVEAATASQNSRGGERHEVLRM